MTNREACDPCSHWEEVSYSCVTNREANICPLAAGVLLPKFATLINVPVAIPGNHPVCVETGAFRYYLCSMNIGEGW